HRISLLGFLGLVSMLAACRRPVTGPMPSSVGYVALVAAPPSIKQGESVNLSWWCLKATSCSISSVGNVAQSGSLFVSPVMTTTWVLTARFPSGTVTRAATVLVQLPAPGSLHP